MRRIKVAIGQTADVTDDCAVLTVTEAKDDLSVEREAKEHGSFVEAIEYLRHELSLQAGDWDRIYIINAEREQQQ